MFPHSLNNIRTPKKCEKIWKWQCDCRSCKLNRKNIKASRGFVPKAFMLFVQYLTNWSMRNHSLIRLSRSLGLKEQYPVTAHAPSFDFRTGCREIKRCEKSKSMGHQMYFYYFQWFFVYNQSKGGYLQITTLQFCYF